MPLKNCGTVIIKLCQCDYDGSLSKWCSVISIVLMQHSAVNHLWGHTQNFPSPGGGGGLTQRLYIIYVFF
jgi:hypothetical protein